MGKMRISLLLMNEQFPKDHAVITVTHLVVLIGSDGYEIRFWKNVRPESAVGQLQNVIGSNNMEPGLVFVHRV